MEALHSLLHSRIRNQISNVVLFGSIIALTGLGLIAGASLGVVLVGRTAAHEWAPALRLAAVVLSTVMGLAAGVFGGLLASPLILRYAFFAKRVGTWNGVAVFSAADHDLPGRGPNVFVAGFAFARGALKPAIFVSEGAAAILSREALRAVFAHEVSHLECHHLLRRVCFGVMSFVAASLLASIALIGLQWSGYTEIGGALSAISGILPAALTWMTIRRLLWTQELEADAYAVDHYGTAPEALILALETLQRAIGGNFHPLVAVRIEACRAKIRANADIKFSSKAA